MGNGMNKIITGVYVGNFRDSKDREQLNNHGITHILSIHDNAKALLEDKKYLCIVASDTPDQPLTQFFPECIHFIHQARLEGGRVLIHCLAGVSRSVTVTAAYLMTAVGLSWRDALNCIRGARSCANPNFGFQKQLQDYEHEGLAQAREVLNEKLPNYLLYYKQEKDREECEINLKSYRNYLATGERQGDNRIYTLPHRAYGERHKPTDSTESATNSDRDNDTATKDTRNSDTGASNTATSADSTKDSAGTENCADSQGNNGH